MNKGGIYDRKHVFTIDRIFKAFGSIMLRNDI